MMRVRDLVRVGGDGEREIAGQISELAQHKSSWWVGVRKWLWSCCAVVGDECTVLRVAMSYIRENCQR